MKVIPTKIPDVLIIEPNIFNDERGYFMESYNKKLFTKHGLVHEFVQDNQSKSRTAGTIRGLHYQLAPYAQTKIVRCVQGAIYDVAVDMRQDSPTYGQWVGEILTADNGRQLLVPKGFAHGFCTLTPDTIIAYKVDEFYHGESDRAIIYNDPDLAIGWPVSTPFLSSKDLAAPTLRECENNFYMSGEIYE